ncbi:MAG: hypothetical protein ACK57U_01655 [Planctomycetota bacterium]
MPAFQATWTTLLLLFLQDSTEWATGKTFESAARRSSVSVFWEQAPLRPQLQALSRNQRVAILLDRRVDPTQKIDWRSRDLNLEQFLWELGADQTLGVTQVGDLFYFGPRETALALAEQNRLWTQRVQDATLSPELRHRLNQTIRWKSPNPYEPVTWLSKDLASANLELLNPEHLPFDLWGPIDWPSMPRYQAYLLLLAGFGQGLDVEGDSLRLAPLQLPPELTCSCSLEGLDRSAVDQLAGKFPELELEFSGKLLSATGKPPLLSELQRQIALLRSTDKEAGGTQVFTLKTNAARGSILATIAQQLGVKLNFAEEIRPLLNERIELDVQRVSLEELLAETLRGTELQGELIDGLLKLKAKQER